MQTKVLVVDDDTEMTELLKIVLEPICFEVITANSGREGIELARKLKPDVMVLDLHMPEMDGWEVCHEIRRFSQMPILVLSAMSKPGMVAQALNEGADDFLTKPTPANTLVAHIKKLARRARAEQEAEQSKLGVQRI